MPERSYRVLLWTVALTGLALDQASKYGVFAWKLEGPDNTYAVFRTDQGTGFELVAQPEEDGNRQLVLSNGRRVPHVNQGALFCFLRDPKAMANPGFALITLLAAAPLVFWSPPKTTNPG